MMLQESLQIRSRFRFCWRARALAHVAHASIVDFLLYVRHRTDMRGAGAYNVIHQTQFLIPDVPTLIPTA